ncbi:MAG: thiamine-binding protein [Actinomycetota bacterium]|jgi:uncharacterized protein YqgV (UPF0045/DUF77 family)|uniref:thiamine-binding protein n=1 Tax=uncultured Ilumatobacter sp. TaxID=879968 RepID=UPI00374E861C|nr:thiamine-binding protein [Actinomycetota bacterium]
MANARLEVFVEPFRENAPGSHVSAVIKAATAAGLEPDMGPFATEIQGDVDVLAGAIAEMIRAGFSEGATAMQLRIETT